MTASNQPERDDYQVELDSITKNPQEESGKLGAKIEQFFTEKMGEITEAMEQAYEEYEKVIKRITEYAETSKKRNTQLLLQESGRNNFPKGEKTLEVQKQEDSDEVKQAFLAWGKAKDTYENLKKESSFWDWMFLSRPLRSEVFKREKKYFSLRTKKMRKYLR